MVPLKIVHSIFLSAKRSLSVLAFSTTAFKLATMDDLLALMEEQPSTEEAQLSPNGSNQSPVQRNSRQSASKSSFLDNTDVSASTTTVAAATSQASQQQQLCLNVDEKVDIRMIRRKVSSIDLIDMLAENPYHSTASLSAMSLAGLNRLLVEPAAVVADPSNVCGKTSIVTVGIVFSNSGTRVASSGNAYCAVTIGNLRTGPAVSALLFGSVYSQFCQACVPGKVIALLCPRLIPPKKASAKVAKETSVTFSLNDDRQIRLVGDARDYAVCKATIRGKRDDGQWASDAKHCKQFVDKRVGEFCQMHRKQANVKGGDAARGSTTMRQLRLEASEFPTTKAAAASQQGSILSNYVQERSSHSAQMMAQFQAKPALTVNSNLRGVPMQMTKQQPATTNRLLAPPRKAQAPARATLSNNRLLAPSNNPYARTKPPPVQTQRAPIGTARVPQQPAARKQPVTQNWLQEGGAKRRGPLGTVNAAAGNKKRAINTQMTGFNGSVPVPKTSKLLFASGPAGQPSARMGPAGPGQAAHADAIRQAQALAQQKELAGKMQEQQSKAAGGKPRPPRGGKVQGVAKVDPRQALRDSLFGSLNADEKERIVSQKSRFANEAGAEEYARSRRIVTELEQEESKKEFKASNTKKAQQGNASGASSIKTEFFCQTCRQSFSRKPVGCYKARHQVKTERKIEETKTIVEKRTALSDKRAEDGGLKLGTGIEWSRWNNRFS